MGNGKTDYGQSGGNGFPGIKRMFFIQKIGQGIVGFHGKCGNGFRRTRRTMNEMLPDFKANAYHSFSMLPGRIAGLSVHLPDMERRSAPALGVHRGNEPKK